MLKEQRKGEDDNVIAFEQPQLATAPKPPGEDWLRTLPMGCRFLCKPKSVGGPTIQWFGVGQIEDKAVLLATDHEFNPGHLKFTWVDSAMFSDQNRFVQLLPDMKEAELPYKEREEGLPPEE